MKDNKSNDKGLNGKNILVTGGTGSFGRAFVRTVLASHNPAKLVIYSRDEHKQVAMAEDFSDSRLRFFIGDIRDLSRLTLAMREIDIVVHAAAMKHVPVAEYNPMECVRTNVLGADNIVRASLDCGVDRVVALSTDKASNPINLYGATKLVSDKIFIASQNLSGSIGTRFCVVRYGNVIGSRGSVVLTFKRLIEEGAKELPITDDRMTRFWITLDHGVNFVISSLETMHGGELFVPKIPSMKVVDLASAMAPQLKQKIVGIRPGEKLHETMISSDDARDCLDLGDRYVVQPRFSFWNAHNYANVGKPVSESFTYASDNNSRWLEAKDLRGLLVNGVS
ncbi:MAG TPA: UDP-N-acetylglucosamine 4,6-dehydratase (inverting) [Afipia sp.]